MSRTTYATLFAAIGTAYGAGDGSTTFNVPDLRGRFIRGVDGTAGRDPDNTSRTAMNSGGNTGDSVGSIQADAFRSHSHTYGLQTSAPGASTAIPSVGGANPRGFTESTDATGGNETRPINAYVNFIIKY